MADGHAAPDRSAPLASIVIPAHNEGRLIERCLNSLGAGRPGADRGTGHDTAGGDDRVSADPDLWEIVVVCNGCTDDTAARARRVPGVTVLEIDEPSKVAALNAGDAHATAFPRLYLDADVIVDEHTLRAVVDALTDGAPAAAPHLELDLAGCTLLSRAYFRIWSRLGYVNEHLIGSGFYGLSAQGRSRFGNFPDLISDDGYVYSHFAPHERVNPAGTSFTVRAPATIAATVRRRIRIVVGNRQLVETGRRMSVPGPGWSEVVAGQPRLVPSAVVFVLVNLIADLAARRRLRRGGRQSWNRDDSSRGGT